MGRPFTLQVMLPFAFLMLLQGDSNYIKDAISPCPAFPVEEQD
jgi:hypothetical protein